MLARFFFDHLSGPFSVWRRSTAAVAQTINIKITNNPMQQIAQVMWIDRKRIRRVVLDLYHGREIFGVYVEHQINKRR